MGLFGDIRKYYTFCKGLRGFLVEPLSLAKSKQTIIKNAERREELFLNLLEKSVYNNDKSPYRRILNHVGYSFKDIKGLLHRIGLEHTLRRLYEDGIYLTFDEFKGRRTVHRGGKEFHLLESDFDNPLLGSSFDVRSGGTLGPGTRTMIDFDFLSYDAAHRAMALDIYGLMDVPCILWFPVLPGNAGIMNVFRQVKIDRPPMNWFSQVDSKTFKPSIKDRLATRFSLLAGRLFGTSMPSPEYVDLNEAHRIAEFLYQVLQEHPKCAVWTYVSSAIRICMAARHRSLDLGGINFFVSGESVTSTKLEEIRSAGAHAIPYFAFVEGGIAAYGCPHPTCPDDMHVLKDRMALITHERTVQHSQDVLHALLFTSLLPESPKILLNVETGDQGVVSSHRCSCAFENIGFSDHLSSVTSFEKLTSEGMTFMLHDLLHIVEEVLPKKHGGSSADYQLLEKSNDHGVTSIDILASPRIGNLDEGDVINTLLEGLARQADSKRLMTQVWLNADTIHVKRTAPVHTSRGKIFPMRHGEE